LLQRELRPEHLPACRQLCRSLTQR
jgi:hypothetical protein